MVIDEWKQSLRETRALLLTTYSNAQTLCDRIRQDQREAGETVMAHEAIAEALMEVVEAPVQPPMG